MEKQELTFYAQLHVTYNRFPKSCLVQKFERILLVLGNISLSVSLKVRKEA